MIARLSAALRPGGALALEDSAGVNLTVTPPAPVFDRLADAWERAGRAMGWRATYGVNLLGDVRAGGLIELKGHEYLRLGPVGHE